MIALPDVNVLLALVWSHHPHHEAAHRWFAQAAAEGWATCLLTQTGLLRLSLNPQIVGVAIDGQAAMQLLQQLVAHPQHHYVDQAPALTATDFEVLIPTAVPSWMCYTYPQWANHPWASCGVIRSNASAMAWSNCADVRAALARKIVFNFDQHSSIGDKSGE